MLTALVIILIAILILAGLVYLAELQTTIAFIIDRGGLWLNYSSGIGRFRVSGYQIRLMADHDPRAWMRKKFTGKLKETDFSLLMHTLTHRKKEPINLPIGSLFDIGVKVIIRDLDVHAKIGIEDDAAATALLCGIIATLLQSLRSVSTRGEFVPRGDIEIRPVFTGARLSVRLKCILAVKARHIIREVIESIPRRGNDGQSSDREHNADHDGKYTQHG